jgi:hypothetical protein
MECLFTCQDQACMEQCYTDYADGVPLLEALMYCQFCVGCPTVCDAASMGIQC